MDRETHEIHLANWRALIEQCQARPEGQTTKQWLSDYDIPEKQYYYWLRKVRKRAVAEMGTKLPTAPGPDLQHHAVVALAEFLVEDIVSHEALPAITIK